MSLDTIIKDKPTIDDVRKFWDTHPLFAGESKFEAGTKDFFEEHKKTVLEDCFAGVFKDELFFPPGLAKDARILDLGCGIGFWVVEFLRRGYKDIYAADLTQRSLEITQKNLDIHNLKANLTIQNAEHTTYIDGFFDHINCQGVIHHTPDTEGCIREIARILKKGGTANISVYHHNLFLKIWPMISVFGELFYKLGFRMRGRGREDICANKNTMEVVRLYDGKNNPIGKAYTREQMIKMVRPYFNIEGISLNYFPARALPFKMPKSLHRFFSQKSGFMVHMNLQKR